MGLIRSENVNKKKGGGKRYNKYLDIEIDRKIFFKGGRRRRDRRQKKR
jgi:hypothetical protein